MAEAEPETAKKSSIDEARDNFTNDSAFMIAYERAIETEKGEEGDRLINDPFARILAGDKGKDLSDSFGETYAPQFGLWTDFHKQWTVVRTKFIDDHISRIIQERKEGPLQFLNLGAGLDTRVLRLDCMENISAAYEVDMDAINEPKNKFFEAIGTGPSSDDAAKYKFKCPREVVSTDFTNDGELEKNLSAAGHNVDIPTIVLAEGLIMYLGEKSDQLLIDVSKIAGTSGSWLILNFIEHPGFTADHVRDLLIKNGWTDLKFNMFGDDVLNYGRFNTEYEPSKCFSFVVCHKK